MTSISSLSSSFTSSTTEPEGSLVTEWSQTKSAEIAFLPSHAIQVVEISKNMSANDFLNKIQSTFYEISKYNANGSHKLKDIKDINIFVENEGYFYSSSQPQMNNNPYENKQRSLNIILKDNSKIYFIPNHIFHFIPKIPENMESFLPSELSNQLSKIPKELGYQIQVLNPSFIQKNLHEYSGNPNFQDIISSIISLRNKILVWNWSQRANFVSDFIKSNRCLDLADPVINETNQAESSAQIGTHLSKVGSNPRSLVYSCLGFRDLLRLHRTCKLIRNERDIFKGIQSWEYLYNTFQYRGKLRSFDSNI